MDGSARKRVLAVDDEPSARLLVLRVLQRAGYEVTAVASAEEAMALFDAGHRYDVLIADEYLPRMSGTELVGEARKLMPDLPVVLVTAAPTSTPPGGHKLEVYLPKPFKNLSALEEAVRAAFATKKVHAARQEMQRTLNDAVSALGSRDKPS